MYVCKVCIKEMEAVGVSHIILSWHPISVTEVNICVVDVQNV